MQKNKCMKCGKPATNKITRIENGQVMDIYLCAEHAGDASPYLKHMPLSSILETLLKKGEAGAAPIEPQAAVRPGLKCSNCQLTYEAYKKSLILGCSECYASFHEELLLDLRKIHGDTRHAGRKLGGGEIAPRLNPVSAAAIESEAAGPIPKSSPTAGGQILLKDPQQAIHELTRAMQQAIAAEDYTRAAIYRDQIRELKERQDKK